MLWVKGGSEGGKGVLRDVKVFCSLSLASAASMSHKLLTDVLICSSSIVSSTPQLDDARKAAFAGCLGCKEISEADIARTILSFMALSYST